MTASFKKLEWHRPTSGRYNIILYVVRATFTDTPLNTSIDHSHIVLIIGDLNGMVIYQNLPTRFIWSIGLLV